MDMIEVDGLDIGYERAGQGRSWTDRARSQRSLRRAQESPSIRATHHTHVSAHVA